jgi:hypothetical protein
MAINDIVFAESDSATFELAGVNGTVNDIVFDNPAIEEIVGVNGTVNDIVFDEAVNEIPNAGYPRSRVVNN